MRHSWPWVVFLVGVALGNVLPDMLMRMRKMHRRLTFKPELLQPYHPHRKGPVRTARSK